MPSVDDSTLSYGSRLLALNPITDEWEPVIVNSNGHLITVFTSGSDTYETLQFSASVGSTAKLFPTASGNGTIEEAMIINSFDNSPSERILVSFNSGSNYLSIAPGGSITWEMKGSVDQISVLGNTAAVSCDILIRRKA